MSYTIVYQPVADNALTTAWTNAEPPERRAITDAANELDDALRLDPATHGEARSGSARVAFHPPIVAVFDVSEPDRLVIVREIRYRKR